MPVGELLLPLLVAVGFAVALVSLQSRIAARTAARLTLGFQIGVGCVGFLSATLLALQYWSHSSSFLFHWCDFFAGSHAPADPWVGSAASVVVLVGTVRFVRALLIHARARRELRSLVLLTSSAVTVTSDLDMYAYSLPGSTQRTVISAGMIGALSVDEQAVVLAHEEGHHHNRHDLFLATERYVSALFVPTMLLRRGLKHALERWADEHAAGVIGDRTLVALTVGRTALLISPSVEARFGLGFAPTNPFSTTQRVKSLLQPPRRTPAWAIGLAGGVSAALITQVHHLDQVIQTLCHMP